jgi:hypothetical protein
MRDCLFHIAIIIATGRRHMTQGCTFDILEPKPVILRSRSLKKDIEETVVRLKNEEEYIQAYSSDSTPSSPTLRMLKIRLQTHLPADQVVISTVTESN